MIKIDTLLRYGNPVYADDDRSTNRYLVIKHTLENYKVNEIAGLLDISRKTVHYHYQAIIKEFDLPLESTQCKYALKGALVRAGFSLDLFFDTAPPVQEIPELPIGAQNGS